MVTIARLQHCDDCKMISKVATIATLRRLQLFARTHPTASATFRNIWLKRAQQSRHLQVATFLTMEEEEEAMPLSTDIAVPESSRAWQVPETDGAAAYLLTNSQSMTNS